MHGLFGRFGDAVGRQVVGGREAPGTARDNADTNAGRFGVDDVLHLVFASDHELAQVFADAYVAVSGAVGLGRIQRHVGEPLLHANIQFFVQRLGGNHVAERGQQQCGQTGTAAVLQEITAIHSQNSTEYPRGSRALTRVCGFRGYSSCDTRQGVALPCVGRLAYIA